MKVSPIALASFSMLLFAACVPVQTPAPTGTTASSSSEAMMNSSDAMMKSGAYKDETSANLSADVLTDGATKVLFFHAAWCPTCKAANTALTALYQDGTGLLTVYKLNYDNETALKQKYGVTYQHTFVKVDGQGNVIKSITGPSDAELQELLKA